MGDKTNHSVNSSLPNSAVAPCATFTHLALSQNLLVRPLLDTLTTVMPSLAHLNLIDNIFFDPIPPPSSNHFQAIQELSLVANQLTSTVLTFLGNLITLSSQPLLQPRDSQAYRLQSLWRYPVIVRSGSQNSPTSLVLSKLSYIITLSQVSFRQASISSAHYSASTKF